MNPDAGAQRLAIMQPYLFPYLGYFQLLHAVDTLVLYDDVTYIKRGWINRNRLLVKGAPWLFTLPLANASQNALIKDLRLAEGLPAWRQKWLKTLAHAYAKAPHYDEPRALIEPLLRIGQGQVVAILHDKRATAYALMLACQRLGVLYTNLDPGSPTARLQRMLATARPALIAHTESHAPTIAGLRALEALPPTLDYGASDFVASLLSQLNPRPADRSVSGHAPAYLMFTSGSTGVPKGVVIAQYSVLNFIRWCRQDMGIGADEVLTGINPMHFDNAVFDFHGALFTSATPAPFDETSTARPKVPASARAIPSSPPICPARRCCRLARWRRISPG